MNSNSSQSVDHIVALLDCFTSDQAELGVREAARKIGLSVSSVGRLMAALREAGVLRQNPDNRAYALAGKVLAWADAYSAAFDIRKIALRAIEDLHRATQETISLYVLEGNERVCVERMESPHSVRIVARIGRRLPLYAGSAGKLMLAFLPEARREEILASVPLQPFTPNTIVDLDVLRTEIAKIRRQGFAYSCGEWIMEAAGVAAPILGRRGELLAALTISGPAQRFTPELVEKYSKYAVEIAAQISIELGFNIGYLQQ